MKVNLMFRDRDFDIKAKPYLDKDTLTSDLGLERILSTMAQGDEIIYAACSTALFCPLQSIEEIRYRQENLCDALRNPDAVRQLYEIAVVGNELDTADKRLYIITGANQGGKTTFLRSIGQAQLMAQCGMFVGAESFSVPIRKGVFTHFKKEEDATMKSGKLDEELSRMSKVVDHLKPGSLMLLNESFAATNEREGSEICRQITKALIDCNVEVFSVTHLYTYASTFLNHPNTQFLRAQRLENGERTFKIVPSEPMQTAFGVDLYRKIFADSRVK